MKLHIAPDVRYDYDKRRALCGRLIPIHDLFIRMNDMKAREVYKRATCKICGKRQDEAAERLRAGGLRR